MGGVGQGDDDDDSGKGCIDIINTNGSIENILSHESQLFTLYLG